MKDHPSQWIHNGLTCRDVAERASHYLEDRLPLSTKILVGLHLASCAGCRSYVKQIAAVCETLAGLPKLYPPPINRLHLRQQFAAYYGQSVSGN
jgi:predicted anti-sigma-YlaC factor YlaD